MEDKDTKRLNIVIPEELHRRLKIAAFENGYTMGTYVAQAIEEKIDRDNQKKEGNLIG